tara:strand:+ start:20837 stop:22729 length:1893 start_codon:yes stop_codon:yes gene_type:complete
MFSLQLLQVILNASSQAFSISHAAAYNQEIVDGGTKNRIWSFINTYALANISLFPLMLLFPAIDFGLVLLGSGLVLGAFFYTASIAQKNQMLVNLGELNKIQTLPWDLHEHQLLMKSSLFLSLHLQTFFLLFYGLSLVACVFLGNPLYAFVSFGMYALDQLNQHGYMPNFLKTPYMYLGVAITLLAVCGVTSVLGVGLSLGLLSFTAIDYIRCKIWGVDSPTAQFPMTDLSQQVKVPSFEANDAEATQVFNTLLKTRQQQRYDVQLQVTFDHFYASHHIMNRLLEGAPTVKYEKYTTLFNAIKFTDKAFENNMLNEMCLHDKFNGQELAGLSKEELVKRQITFLKQEMRYFVERLQQSSYRDFTHEQAATMHRYARLLLLKIEALSPDKQALYLLHIAMTTGSHCNRMYLESLSALASKENLLVTASLNLHDTAMLRAQETREVAFRTYYHEAAPRLRDNSPYFRIVWADTGDYHTYEDFVGILGANFYLMNASFTTGFRNVSGILVDRFLTLLAPRGGQMLFCEHYTVDYLVGQAVNPEKKLYKILERWCDERHIVLCPLNEYSMPAERAPGELRALAELMLLDLNIIDVKKPVVSRHAWFQPAPLSTDNVVSSSNNSEPSLDMNHANA